MKPKVTIILLTWQRLDSLPETLSSLSRQTYKDFDVYVSNANVRKVNLVNKIIRQYSETLSIRLSHDSNERYGFRRFDIGKDLREAGTDIVMFLDDDIQIPDNYVEICISKYRPKTYQSAYAWSFQEGGSDYYRHRTRVYSESGRVHYGGTGAAMIDSSVFLEEGLFDVDRKVYKIEDLWLSYYTQSILGWDVEFMDIPGLKVNGNDRVALNKHVREERYNKRAFLRDLVKLGWILE
jgi:GT2 family glycosyltransferase